MNSLSKVEDGWALMWAKRVKAIRMIGGECIKCKESRFWVLDFHHPDSDKKDFTINTLGEARWTRFWAEASKCQIVCANCHADMHGGYGRNYEVKRKLAKLMKLDGCSRCSRQINLPALDFHHVCGGKKFGINSVLMRKKSISLECFLDELLKCEVVCRNCHRDIHFYHKRYQKLGQLMEKKIREYQELREPLDRAEIMRMYDGGMRQVDIVRHFGCSKATISLIVSPPSGRVVH